MRRVKKCDFYYELPLELIAQRPAAQRSASRLLCVQGADGGVTETAFDTLPGLLRTGDLLVFNDTRVVPARLYGQKDSGGRVEVLVERLVDARDVLVQIRASKAPRSGMRILVEDGESLEVVERREPFYLLRYHGSGSVLDMLERIGRIPLPPYIERDADGEDRERYQTVYARQAGAVAAPTAGLHFDEALMARLKESGVDFGYLTLHVGAGTFQPMRTDSLEEHRMHSEWIDVSQALCRQIEAARRGGGRVIAVGTTVVRALETAAASGRLAAYAGETDIFIYPGYRFRCIDGLITNFHLPESTLLMLVCAFGGYGNVMRAYRYAVERKYRFFSYGDAMLVWPDPAAIDRDNHVQNDDAGKDAS